MGFTIKEGEANFSYDYCEIEGDRRTLVMHGNSSSDIITFDEYKEDTLKESLSLSVGVLEDVFSYLISKGAISVNFLHHNEQNGDDNE